MSHEFKLSSQQRDHMTSLSHRRLGPVRIAAFTLAVLLAAVLLRWLFLQFRKVELHPTRFTTPPIGPDAVNPALRRLIVSDLHLGAGDRADDFNDDPAFDDFITHYGLGSGPTELILAGDTIEFLQVRLDDIADDDWSEMAAVRRLETVITAHDQVFTVLARFLELPGNQLTILIGNHDFELHYPACKALLHSRLGLKTDDPCLRFGISYHGGGIYLVHGNQFDDWNRFVHFDGISEPFEVVRGTQLVKEVINHLEEDPLPVAPLIDNVKPTSALFWYMVALPRLRRREARRFVIRGVTGFLQVVALPTPHHLPIYGKWSVSRLSGPLIGWIGSAVARFRRRRVSRHLQLARQVSAVAGNVEPPAHVLKQMQSEAGRQLEREVKAFDDNTAREMLWIANRPEHRADLLFVCGHTHRARVVPLGGAKVYINTGTWTEIIYDVAAMRRQNQRYPFLEVTYPDGVRPLGRLLVWKGVDEPPQLWIEGDDVEQRRGLFGYNRVDRRIVGL
jgi:UDP-2,3-diacylglucosamine pyrophosphatase LpxH